MNLFNLFPLIMQALKIGPQIIDALKTGQSVFSILEKFGPGLLEVLKEFGKSIWPDMEPEHQVQAAAQANFDQASIKFAQDAVNKLGLASPALAVDGIMGQKTKAAVVAFQQKFKVDPADGWPGPLTQAAMQQQLNGGSLTAGGGT